MKYRLVNKYGNAVYYTDNEKEKNQLLDRGFHIQEIEKPSKPTTKKRKAVIKDESKPEDKNRP